jgi:hypothetical protein
MSHKVLRRAAALVLAAVAAPVAILAASPPARAATPHLCETYGRYCLGSADLNVGTYVQERTPGRDLVLTPLGGRYDGHPTFLFQFSSDNSKCAGTQSPGGGSLIIQLSLATGQAARAVARYTAALGLASRIGDQYEQARAHDGLARGHHAVGEADQARRHWQRALALFSRLGTPEAGELRSQLIGV